jgi:Tol biopolymer transport system component
VGGRDTKGRYGIFSVDARTAQSSILVNKEERENPPIVAGVSPDGRKLYYTTRRWEAEQGSPIVNASNQYAPSVRVSIEKDLTTGSLRVLHQDATLSLWMLSPDARYIAGISASKPGSMFVLPTAGGELRELPIKTVWRESSGGWAADSSAMYVIKASGELWRSPIDGSKPLKVDLKWDTKDLVRGGFRVHPDGQRIASQTRPVQKPNEIWVLENFLPAPLAANK